MMRPQGRYIIIGITLMLIVLLPARKYFWGKSTLNGDMQFSDESIRTPVNADITIVTMYLNIGGFLKHTSQFTPQTYKRWMTTWGWLTNRVIAFFDNDEDLKTFRKIRSVLPPDKTVLMKIERREVPAFNNLEKIRTIYKNSSYPKHRPNTVVAEYSCTMNAKYDVLRIAIQKGLVHTEYMAWLDIGLFRNLLRPTLRPRNDRFSLAVPDNFNASAVGMSMVTPRTELVNLSAWDYIRDNQVWVSGAFVLATKEVMMRFAQSYILMANALIDKGMSSTDQQVIGAMYSPEYIDRQQVDIVDYRCHNGQFGLFRFDIIYFCLGYVCKDAAEKQLN